MTLVVELYALAAIGVAAVSMLAVVVVMVLLAIGKLARVLVIEPCHRVLDDRRNAVARTTAAVGRIDAEAADAVRRLERNYIDAMDQVRRQARHTTS